MLTTNSKSHRFISKSIHNSRNELLFQPDSETVPPRCAVTVVSREFFEIFKKTSFTEHLWATASDLY